MGIRTAEGIASEQRTGREVHVVPHTHWDREWYEPFQVFRLELVDLLDELIPRLESGAAGPHFLLDGQVAAVDDYLELRPGMAARLAALVAAGRLAIGPWYVLPDEFLVSGETLVRDLQLGLQRGTTLGGAMSIGYLPDMFGHIAQMPQILCAAGFHEAVVWRGVPSTVVSREFLWSAPDGSTVRAEYLPEGYGNGAFLPEDPDELVAAVRRFVDRHGSLVDGPVLWMNGTDHLEPAPHLVAVLDAANERQSAFRFSITTLAEHFASTDAPRDARTITGELHTVTGELRSGARANLLMGVVSNRVDVRSAAARAETALERLAEPLAALFTDAPHWPGSALDHAWLEVIRNAAHDSVCACSHDDVVKAVLHRYTEATQIADTLVERAMYWFGCSPAASGTVVCNTTGRPRRALVEVPPGQAGGPRLVTTMVPAFGWTTVDSDLALDVPAVRIERGGNTLSNATVRVDIDDVTGTISVNGHADVGRLVDGGDAGDTYNWCPPAHDTVVDTPRRVVVLVLDSDPTCGRVAIDRTYRIGRRVIDGQRADPVDGIIRTVVELRAGESFVRVAVDVDNVWCDHRLRMIVPLAHPATHSEAECAFTTVERGLDAEGGPTELAMPTFPARRFVRAGGVTIAHDAVNEYELVDIRDGSDGVRRAHALALTVLRATGMLSQGPMDTRPEPAGPELPLEGPQLAGRVLRRFAIAVDDVDPYALADAFTPFPMVWAPGGGTRARTGSFLQVDGAEVSAVRHECGRTLVRVFNPAPTERDVRVHGRRGQVVDLTGRVIDDFDGVLALRPHGIATIALEPLPPSDA